MYRSSHDVVLLVKVKDSDLVLYFMCIDLLSACVSVYHMYGDAWEIRSPGTEVNGQLCATMLGTKQVLLEKQPVFLTAYQSIQPPAPGFLMKLD